jgi:hypothetical protein
MATPDRKNLCLQSVLLRQLTKTVDSGFIRRALPAEVQSEKLFHRTGIKRLFLGLCVGKVLPDLQKAQFERPQNRFNGAAWAFLLGPTRCHYFHEDSPGHHRVDGSQEKMAVGRFPLPVKAAPKSEGPLAEVLPEYFSPHRLYPSEGFWEGMVS